MCIYNSDISILLLGGNCSYNVGNDDCHAAADDDGDECVDWPDE